jgi:hypothetical protein
LPLWPPVDGVPLLLGGVVVDPPPVDPPLEPVPVSGVVSPVVSVEVVSPDPVVESPVGTGGGCVGSGVLELLPLPPPPPDSIPTTSITKTRRQPIATRRRRQ